MKKIIIFIACFVLFFAACQTVEPTLAYTTEQKPPVDALESTTKDNTPSIIQTSASGSNTTENIDGLASGSSDNINTTATPMMSTQTLILTEQTNTETAPQTAAQVTTVMTIIQNTDASNTTNAPSTTPPLETTVATTTPPEEHPTQPEIQYPLSYSDKTGSITIDKIWYGGKSKGAWCYVAELNFTDYDRFYSVSAYDKYLSGYETTSAAAARENAIFTVDGDCCYASRNRTVIRSGELCNDNNFMYYHGIYNGHTGILSSVEAAGLTGVLASEAATNGLATDTISFTPYILENGESVVDFDALPYLDTTSRAQRTFIGTDGTPGHLIIVVSEGRYKDGVSAGLTYPEMANLLIEYGCTFGIPLDGGGSAAMIFQGTMLNTQEEERAVLDFFCFK